MENGLTGSGYTIGPSSCYVRIAYSVKIAGGQILKGASEPAAMDFVTGYKQVVPGLERRLLGKSVGMRLAFTVPAEEAFGTRNEELLIEKKTAEFHFPAGMKPYPGMEIALVAASPGAPETVTITAVRDDSIIIDLNHPFAGADLEYDLQIVEARPATSEDICSEWNESPVSDTCCSTPHEIVLGQAPDSMNN